MEILIIIFLIFSFLFEKRIRKISGEDFSPFFQWGKLIDSKLHYAIFFIYLCYKDYILWIYGVAVQVFLILIILSLLR